MPLEKPSYVTGLVLSGLYPVITSLLSFISLFVFIFSSDSFSLLFCFLLCLFYQEGQDREEGVKERTIVGGRVGELDEVTCCLTEVPAFLPKMRSSPVAHFALG